MPTHMVVGIEIVAKSGLQLARRLVPSGIAVQICDISSQSFAEGIIADAPASAALESESEPRMAHCSNALPGDSTL